MWCNTSMAAAAALALWVGVGLALGASPEREVRVGDDACGVVLSLVDGRLLESSFEVAGEALEGLAAEPWAIALSDRSLAAPDDRATLLSAGPDEASFAGENDSFRWKLRYEALGPGRITKTLTLVPKHDLEVQRVFLWQARSSADPLVARTGLQDIAAFYREGGRGLFVSLDFPYSQIASAGGLTTVGYPPFDLVRAGEEYTCHSLTIGATRVAGRVRYGFYEGEVEAMDRYVQERFAPRFSRPLFSTACINNRFTQLEGDWVFYTMRDHPTLTMNRDLLKRELQVVSRLGMEYYQVFPGAFDWGPDDPSPAMVEEAVKWARRDGLRLGDYSGANHLFCPHYNQHRNTLDRPEWRMRDEQGNLGAFCFGRREFVEFYAERVVSTCRRFGFELHALDFLSIAPCFAADHGHPAGPESIYSQVRGLVQFLEAVNAVSPEMLTWPNSGNWSEFLPKLAWYAPSLYLTDPYVATPWQGLNQTRILDDSRREQMVGLHYSHFVPYRFFTNCQYFFSQNSIVPDARGNCEYGALSTLAVTPNLCLAEVRPWLDAQSPATQERVIAFYRKWTAFVREHFGLWTRTYHVGEDPAPGGVEVYSHAEGDHGFVFIVNPQYWSRTVGVPLDASLGFTRAGKCEVVELYPQERLRLTAQGPFARLGTTLPVRVEAQQVLVLEIGSAPSTITEPRLYGVPGTVEATEGGYLLKARGPQGTTARAVVLLPSRGPRVTSARLRCDLPAEDLRQAAQSSVSLLASDERGALIEVTFRREQAPTELRTWAARGGSLPEGMAAGWPGGLAGGRQGSFPLLAEPRAGDTSAPSSPLGPLAAFCGGYVGNAFSEVQEAWIELGVGGEAPAPADGAPEADRKLASLEAMPPPAPLDTLATETGSAWWLQTQFHLPFMYTLGCEPPPDDHTILVLPLLGQPRVADLRAWVNGSPLHVTRYDYPRARQFGCYYADLVGPAAHHGDNTLVVYYEVAP